MNRIIIAVVAILAVSLSGCSKDELVVDYDLAAQEYELPRGESGSVEERIYEYHQKYGTYILYDFTDEDIYPQWTKDWNMFYTKADPGADNKNIERILDILDKAIFSKYDAEFIRSTFPYRVFLTDKLLDKESEDDPDDDGDYVLSNEENSMALAYVSARGDDLSESDWSRYEVDLVAMYTVFYYNAMPVKPAAFVASRHQSILLPRVSDPEGVYETVYHSAYMVGHVRGQMGYYGPNYLTPKEADDYGAFVAFLTGEPATKIMDVIARFPLVKARVLQLYSFLVNELNLDVVGTQNTNVPDDKLPAGYFDNL